MKISKEWVPLGDFRSEIGRNVRSLYAYIPTDLKSSPKYYETIYYITMSTEKMLKHEMIRLVQEAYGPNSN